MGFEPTTSRLTVQRVTTELSPLSHEWTREVELFTAVFSARVVHMHYQVSDSAGEFGHLLVKGMRRVKDCMQMSKEAEGRLSRGEG